MIPEKPRILVVDDETKILRAFAWEYGENFDIITSTDPVQALDIVTRDPLLDVIISDQRMPVMTGAELLSQARQVNPDAQRIVTTAYSDIDALILCVNDAEVFGYLDKPWEPERVLPMLQQALTVRAEHQRFLQQLQADVQHWAHRTRLRRQRDLTRIAGLCDYSKIEQLIGQFVATLARIAVGDQPDWADVVLFDAAFEEKLMLEFLRRVHGLSRNGRHPGAIQAERAVAYLHRYAPLTLQGAGWLNFLELSVVANLARLLVLLDPTRRSLLTLDLRSGRPLVSFRSTAPFVDSILSPTCAATATTLFCNALLFDTLAKVSILGARFQIETDVGLRGRLDFTASQ